MAQTIKNKKFMFKELNGNASLVSLYRWSEVEEVFYVL